MRSVTRFKVLPLLGLSLACASTGRPAGTVATGTITVPLFSVDVPAGDWEVTIDSAASRVEFVQNRSWLFRRVQATLISVSVNHVVAPFGVGTAEAVARDYIDNEERLLGEADARGEFHLERTARSVDSIAGRRLYAFRYETRAGGLFGLGGEGVEAVLYLWFPDDFTLSHRFYMFHISEAYKRDDVGVKVDLMRITPVIASFRPRAMAVSFTR